MSKLFYITRSYFPDITGGTLVRGGSVKYLIELGYDVTVIAPNYYGTNIYQKENVIYIPVRYKKVFTKAIEYAGIFEDYLDPWIKDVFPLLFNLVTREDLVMATSGGELGCIKLASILKNKIGCRTVVNLHDPIAYSKVEGRKINKIFHASREAQEYKYLKEMDLIITSSEYYKDVLSKKYPEMKSKIKNNYFGYINNINYVETCTSDSLRIGYGGALGRAQQPELLLDITKEIQGVEVFMVGDSRKVRRLKRKYPKCNFVPHMANDKYVEFVQNNFDIGFVSLVGDYFASCVPSKIYEFINMCKPILAALPNGDAKEIINTNGFGIACYYKDYQGLKKAIVDLSDPIYRNEIIKNMKEQKEAWSMSERIKEVDVWLREL